MLESKISAIKVYTKRYHIFEIIFMTFLISVTHIFQKVHQIEPSKLILELYLEICSAIYILALELHHHC